MQLQTQTDSRLNDVDTIAQDVSGLNVTHITPSDKTCEGLESQVRAASLPTHRCRSCGKKTCLTGWTSFAFFVKGRKRKGEVVLFRD